MPREISFTRWDTSDDWAAGTCDGVLATHRGIAIAAPIGVRDQDGTAYEYAEWTSPWREPGFSAYDLVASWSALTRPGDWVEIAAQARGTDRWSVLGRWADGDRPAYRTSLNGQPDVDTDVWHPRGADAWRLRVGLFRTPGGTGPTVRMLGAVVSTGPEPLDARADGLGGRAESRPPAARTDPLGGRAESRPLAARTDPLGGRAESRPPAARTDPLGGRAESRPPAARTDPLGGRAESRPPAARTLVDVPCFSQIAHRDHGGSGWCSPTSVAMVLARYRALPKSDEKDHPDPWVDLAAQRVFDQAYDGAGNWSFNAAYAAGRTGHGFVTRLRDLRDAEAFVAAGIPLVAAVKYADGALTGAPVHGTDGHLLVICGFTGAGDVVVNDPAAPTNDEVRRTYDRDELERAWLDGSGGIVYVIHDGDHPLPPRVRPARW